MIRCTKCVMPNTRPDTPFVDGVCAACIAYEKRPEIDWDARKKALLDLLERHGGRCIVPSSGGKDSHWQVLTLLELGAKVQVVTASTCHLTPIGRRNIDNLARYAPTIEVTPNRQQRAKLNKLGLELVGDISWPEHVAIFTTPFRMANALATPLIFYGENPQNQYGGPPGCDQALQMTRRWVSEFGGFLGLRVDDVEPQVGNMDGYRLPPEIYAEAHFLGQYLPWNSHLNGLAAMRAGMRCGEEPAPCTANWWCHENLDNAQTGIHDHVMYLKYGYGRGCAQISVDVRYGLISRKDALEWVERQDGRYPYTYAGVPIDEVLACLEMKRDDLWDAFDAFTNWDIFSKTDRHSDGVPYMIGRTPCG